jgi:hypothetical protein
LRFADALFAALQGLHFFAVGLHGPHTARALIGIIVAIAYRKGSGRAEQGSAGFSHCG